MANLIRIMVFLALLIAPFSSEATRMRYSLEQYELSTLTYWRFESSNCGPVALVVDPDGFIHQVVAGNYLGKNDGKVVKITENRIELLELTPDGNGGWLEKPAVIVMHDSN